MQLRALGASGLRVSTLALGTMSWGKETDIHEAKDCLRAYVDSGGNFIDTADVYADGVSEEILAELLIDDGLRPNLVIASKAGSVAGERGADSSRRHLIGSLNASLKRLGTDHLDLWYVHRFDPLTPVAETVSTMQQCVSAGKVRYLGVSNYAAWQLVEACNLAHLSDIGVPYVALQSEYSLLNRRVEDEVVPAAMAKGVGLVAWSPLGRGVLTGKYRFGTPADSRGASPDDREWIAPYLEGKSRNIVDAVCTAAEGLGVSPLEVALAWVVNRAAVSSCVVGARTVGQLKAILNFDETLLVNEIEQALTDVST